MILLDTHTLVWLVADPRKLSRAASRSIQSARSTGGIGIASVTLLEIATLLARGRLRAHGTIEASVQRIVEKSGVVIREITPAIAALATQFPEDFPRDPVDRLIGATARAEGVPLVTKDEKMRASPLIKTVW